MNNLIEKDGKYYKECNVITLESKEESPFILHPTQGLQSTDVYEKELWESPLGKDTYHHLYITSDDEIKEGDWYIYGDVNHRILQSDGRALKITNKLGKKIIATTDKYLKVPCGKKYMSQDLMKVWVQPEKELPRPSNEFVKAYVEKGGFDKLLV